MRLVQNLGQVRVTSSFDNTNPPYSEDEPHKGVDFQMRGTNGPVDFFVPALNAGTVQEARTMTGFGPTVVVRNANDFLDLYGQLSQILVVPGQRIRAGQLLGRSGGKPGIDPNQRTTGQHLHYQRIGPGDLFNNAGKVNRQNSRRPCI
jgi:murein DD-endopeptidase MepM/ murein hydrolase activator NlpD